MRYSSRVVWVHNRTRNQQWLLYEYFDAFPANYIDPPSAWTMRSTKVPLSIPRIVWKRSLVYLFVEAEVDVMEGGVSRVEIFFKIETHTFFFRCNISFVCALFDFIMKAQIRMNLIFYVSMSSLSENNLIRIL